ncbi:MAG TPA: hypothetical protein VMS43_14010 [Allosphingosinicella sp.]|nr:hypothetical protein [Allosphingosinicella sp.]
MSRRTHAQIREAAMGERDIQVAAFLDAYADLVDARRPPPVASQLASAARRLASSIRAGLVDDGMPA